MGAVLTVFSTLLNIFRRRHRTSLSNQQLDDVGFIIDEDYYKRDIVIAGKRISSAPYLEAQIQAIRDVGHLAWLGGAAAAKFANNHFMEFTSILQAEEAPLKLKKQILYAITEICVCTKENREKARISGLLNTVIETIDSNEPELRCGAVACLVSLINQNYTNYTLVSKTPNIKSKLLDLLHEDWGKWRRNEAARIILMLGLNIKKEEMSESENQ